MARLAHPSPLARLLAGVLLGATGCAISGCTTAANPPTILVIDQDAGPYGNGALFRVDPITREVSLFATSKLLRTPQDVMQQPNGDLLLLDYFGEGGVGKIFAVARDGRRVEELKIPPGLVDPYQFVRAPDGSIWIVDKNADPLGLAEDRPNATGTVWRLSPDFAELTIVATGPPLAAPAAVFFVAGEAFVLDADSFKKVPLTPGNDEGAIFRIKQRSNGPGPAELETTTRFRGLVSPLGLHRLPDGDFLIIDVNADPVEPERHRGAIYRVAAASGETSLFANSDEFRAPVNCLPWGQSLLVVDAHADPLGLGGDGVTPPSARYGGDGRGAVFDVDLASGKVRLFVASPLFVNPIRLRAVRL